MRIAGIASDSVVDGPGIRFVLFTQGCFHQCPYCHNPDSHDPDGGYEISVKEVKRILARQRKKVRGVTFSGGEPFLQAQELAQIAAFAHELGLDVVTYTGFVYEELLRDDDPAARALLAESDMLIDGKYVHDLRDTSLRFRGSSNQRILELR
ncbi:MAG: anaerobic ribonucleoside-triphosphate reductase activating protein [Peptococcaceae bacterium]|jgi:anaerobic ribonucleoside-triphosphate reductase activating protein|nr:anaerobic ribonucleoside-triphosphate reductase activating protein [Peptococcaceae bacterium]